MLTPFIIPTFPSFTQFVSRCSRNLPNSRVNCHRTEPAFKMTSLAAACLSPDATFGANFTDVMDEVSLRSVLTILASDLSSRYYMRPQTVPSGLQQKPTSPLKKLTWVKELAPRFQAQADLMGEKSPLGADHVFRALYRHNLVLDNKVFVNKIQKQPAENLSSEAADQAVENPQLLNVYLLGDDVGGHKGLVHGGLTAAIFDETFGYLLYASKASGHLDFKAVVTAQLNVSYLKAIPTKSTVVCAASITSRQGRKIWVAAQMRDQMGGKMIYATATALFIIPK